MSGPTSREMYQRLLRGEVPASAYTDAVKREVAARRRVARKYRRRPWWRFWRWMWFDCPRHGSVWHGGKGRCPICEGYGWNR